jgi:hypothetical protein
LRSSGLVRCWQSPGRAIPGSLKQSSLSVDKEAALVTRFRVTVAATGAALALSSPASSGHVAARGCLPISIANGSSTFTYSVRVEAGHVPCGLARAALRDAADWPPDDDAGGAAFGWRCKVGEDPSSWALSCARGAAIVRGYGPVRERRPWVIAQVRLRIGVLAPSASAGLTLGHIELRPCGKRRWLVAHYRSAAGATLTIGEGRPNVCANLGVAPTLSAWRIHGQPARLLEFCAPAGCARATGEYALAWRERGLGINLLTHRLTEHELLAIARSMTVVPA